VPLDGARGWSRVEESPEQRETRLIADKDIKKWRRVKKSSGMEKNGGVSRLYFNNGVSRNNQSKVKPRLWLTELVKKKNACRCITKATRV